MKETILIGITGGIGSGKSIISGYLSSLGEHVISADDAARRVVYPGETGNKLIRKEFGDGYFFEDGTLDRKKLADDVFYDKEKLLRLNSLLHPLILEYIYSEAKALTGRVFIEAPLLIQAGMHESVDYVWLVTADAAKRIERVVERDGAQTGDVIRRMESQMSDEEMAAYADEVIENNGEPEEIYRKIDRLLKKPEYSR